MNQTHGGATRSENRIASNSCRSLCHQCFAKTQPISRSLTTVEETYSSPPLHRHLCQYPIINCGIATTKRATAPHKSSWPTQADRARSPVKAECTPRGIFGLAKMSQRIAAHSQCNKRPFGLARKDYKVDLVRDNNEEAGSRTRQGCHG